MAVSPPPTTWLRYLFSGCCRTAGRVVLWVLWFILGVLLAFQLKVYFAHEVELPAFALRALERRALHHGLDLKLSRGHFDAEGRIVFEGVEASSSTATSLFVTVDRFEVRVNPLLATAGVFDPQDLHLSKVGITLPAQLSPTGTDLNLLAGGEAAATRLGDDWLLTGAHARVGEVVVTAHGLLPELKRTEESAAVPVDFAALNRNLRLWSARLVALAGVEGAHVDIALPLTAGASPAARIDVSVAQARWPQPVEVPRLGSNPVEVHQLHATVDIPNWKSMPRQVRISTGSIRWGDVAGISSSEGLLRLAPGSPSLVEKAEIQVRGASFRSDRLDFALAAWNTTATAWTASLLTRLWNEPLLAHWQPTPGTGETSLHVETRVSTNLLRGLSPHASRDLGAVLQPSAPAPLAANIRLAANGAPLEASGRLDSGPVGVRGVSLLGAAADFHWKGDDLGFSRIVLVEGESVVRGSYDMNIKTLDYRFLLHGPFRPAGIGPWFRDWWPRFWKRFDFGPPPFANISIDGRWGQPFATRIFLSVDAKKARVREATFDRVRTELFIRPHFVAAQRLLAEEGNTRAEGTFSRKIDLAQEQNNVDTIEFDLVTTTPLKKFVDLFGEDAVSLVAPYDIPLPPRLKAKGWLHGPAHSEGPGRLVNLDVRAWGDLRYLGFPLQDFSANVAVRNDNVTITNVRTQFAGGRVRGDISVAGPESKRSIAFDAQLSGANLGEAIRQLDEFGAQRAGQSLSSSGAKSSGGRFQKGVAAGSLNIQLRARGSYGDPYSFLGTGKAEVFGATLGEINLLGQLSAALKAVPMLNFTSVTLDHVESDFELKGSELSFPKLRLTGPSAEITARGSYFLRSKTMSMDAKVYPFAERRNILASTVDLVLTPISAALELRLEGTLDKPSWYFTHGPTSIFRRLNTVPDPTPKEKP